MLSTVRLTKTPIRGAFGSVNGSASAHPFLTSSLVATTVAVSPTSTNPQTVIGSAGKPDLTTLGADANLNPTVPATEQKDHVTVSIEQNDDVMSNGASDNSISVGVIVGIVFGISVTIVLFAIVIVYALGCTGTRSARNSSDNPLAQSSNSGDTTDSANSGQQETLQDMSQKISGIRDGVAELTAIVQDNAERKETDRNLRVNAETYV